MKNYQWVICHACGGEGKTEILIPEDDKWEYLEEFETVDENGEDVYDVVYVPPTKQCFPCEGTGKIRTTPHVEYPEDSDKWCACIACREERLQDARDSAHLAWREDGCRGDFSDYYIESWDYRDIADRR